MALPTVLLALAAPAAHEIWVHPSDGPSSLHAALDAAASTPTPTTIQVTGRHTLTRPLLLDARHSGTRFVGHGAATISGAATIGGAPGRDGAKNISGWTVHGPAKCPGCSEVWMANIPEGADSRQFYVNGVRANRTWVAFPIGSTKEPKASTIHVPGSLMQGWKHNRSAIELVYRGGDSAGSQWQESRCPVASIANGSTAHASGVGSAGEQAVPTCAADYCEGQLCPGCCGHKERCTCVDAGARLNKTAVYGGHPGSVVCPKSLPICVGYVFDKKWGTCVAAAPDDSGSTVVTVADPCVWNGNTKIQSSQPLRVPAYVENVFELLGSAGGQPGQFYLDAAAATIYYVPHAGQTPENTVGQLPLVETLVEATAVTGVTYDGVAFEHATWMGPSSNLGFVDVQAGFCLTCPRGTESGGGTAACHRETPAALQFHRSSNVSFTGCRFAHLGSNGISFSKGSHGNSVSRCHFSDISASAVAIGTRDDPTGKTTPAQQDLDNSVTDCTVTRVAQEYRGHPGLLVGFTRGSRIEHNEISHVPYTAISLGWGWSRYPHTYDGLNSVSYNHIHDHMQTLGDGGAIYTLGAQGNLPFEMPAKYHNTSAILPPSMQQGNYIHDAGNKATAALDHDGIGEGCHCPGGLYSDEGTTNMNITNNVVANVLIWLQGCRPGCPWIGPNYQDYNWFDGASAKTINVQSRCPLVGDVQVNGTTWPAEAQAVMKAAGPRAA